MDILPFRTRPSNEQPKSRDGLRAVLTALGFGWRYNLRAMRAELREDGGEWCQASDRQICDIRSQIPERFVQAGGAEGDKRKPLAFGRTAFEDCFGALLHRAEVDPFREWLEALPAWDRTGRLDSWLATVFTCARAAAWRRGAAVSFRSGRYGEPTSLERSSMRCPF